LKSDAFFGVTIRGNQIISLLCEIARDNWSGSVIGGATPPLVWVMSG
jgi:hypothetical protein